MVDYDCWLHSGHDSIVIDPVKITKIGYTFRCGFRSASRDYSIDKRKRARQNPRFPRYERVGCTSAIYTLATSEKAASLRDANYLRVFSWLMATSELLCEIGKVTGTTDDTITRMVAAVWHSFKLCGTVV